MAWRNPSRYERRPKYSFSTERNFVVLPAQKEKTSHSMVEITVTGRQRKRSRLSELEPMDTIFVKQVKEGGPAQHAGLHTGDRIVSVNGETVTGKSYAQVIALIQSSDSSLKLLVVPKDEDILQMAYQNSAYNQGQLPYRGHASDIPKPPSGTGHPSSRGPPVRPKPDPKPQGKPPVGPRYKSELRMVPEDECSRIRYSDPGSGPPSLDSVLGRRRTSTGSLGSVSSGTSGSSTREHVIMPLAELAPSRLAKVEDLGSPGEEPSGPYNPPAPKRTSSRNIMLSHFQQLENRSGSLDSISRSSDSSNSRRSVESDPPMSRRSQEYGIPLHVRRSQENVRLSNENLASVRLSGEPLRASAESISQLRHSRENLRHSSDDLLHQGFQSEEKHRLSKSSTTSRLPSVPSHRPTVYTRSHTTSALVNPAPSYTSPSSFNPDCQRVESGRGVWTAPTQVTFSSPQHQSQTLGRSVPFSDHTYSRPSSWSTPTSSYSQHQGQHDNSQEGDLNYGATFKFTFQDGTVEGDPSGLVDVTRVGSGSGNNIALSSGRIGGSDKQINMVTERLRMFESADSFDSLSSGGSGRVSRPLSPRETRSLPHSYKGVPTMGFDTVASRVTQFENFSDQENLSGDEKVRVRRVSTESAPECQRKTSREERWRRELSPTSLSERNLAQALPPSEIDTVPGSPPATINIYFKGETGRSESSVTLQPSPERILSEHDLQYSSSSCSDFAMVDGRDRSPLGSQDLQMSPPSSRRIHKPALRQPSYLTAIQSPHSKMMTPEGVPPSSSSTSLELSSTPAPSPAPSPAPALMVATSASELTTTPVSSSTVMLRQHSTTDDREAKLVRRTSYLMATSKERPQLSSMPMETSKSDSHLQLQVSSPLPVSQTETQPVESKPITSSRPGVKKVGLRLDLSQIPEEPPPPPSSLPPVEEEDAQSEQQEPVQEPIQEPDKAQQQQLLPPRLMEPDVQTTPTKTSNIRKLKAFFGEKTPRIMEATSDHRRVFDMPASVGEIIKEGTLNCKVSITDGKRASDRSWKPMWVMLRKKYLYLFKDKNVASTSPTLTDEQPILIKSCMVDVAYDYTKKKHVFRLTTYNGSEYLFQAEEKEIMLDWIRLIQRNNNVEDEIPAEQENRVTCSTSDLMEKKTLQLEKVAKSSPQAVHKSAKKVSTKSLRSKSPAAHSPGVKQKKTTFDKVDHSDSPKPKDKETKEYSRTWKSKFMFKRGGSSSSVPAEINGTFNVPLECCPRSPGNEFIPLVVEVCTAIVEERGLENQGIYRVPGNTGAVNSLQEELNKVQDGEEVDTSNEKWLDVNVVSSLLKSFFRKLPEALITDELYDHVVAANRVENPEKRMLRIKRLLHRLPDHHFETFRFLALHLSKVASMGHMNKMDARNLAIVFGPTLVRTTDESMITMVKDMSDQCRIVESIILHHDWFFLSWEEDHEVPVDEDGADAPVSGMNQELLDKAEYLELGERGRDISAKDLLSSVLSAANRKKKKVPTATLR